VLFGSQFLGMNFQSAEFAPISNALKATYEKAVAASRSISKTLATPRAEPDRTAKRIDHAGVVGQVPSGQASYRARAAAPLLTTYQIKSQPIRIVRQEDQSHPRSQVLISGLTPPDVRAAVARDIERELARAGCRISHSDGSWNASSQAAMRRFLRNVNAALPINDPDIVLLTLVRGYHGTACGAGCGRNANDYCKPALEAKIPTDVDTPQQAAAGSDGEQDVVHDKRSPARPQVRWVAVPQPTQPTGRQATARKAMPAAASPPTSTAQTPPAAPAKLTGDKSKAGRMALGVPHPQPVERVNSPTVETPVGRNHSAITPSGLPAPYAPGAPRLVPDQKPATEVAAPQPQHVAPETRRPRRDASWRKRAFEVEN